MTEGTPACLRCGSTRLKMPGFADGLVPETDNLGEWVCGHCGWKGIPVFFEDPGALEEFRATLTDAESA